MGVTSLDPRAFIPVARSAMLGMLKQSHREQLSHSSTTECQLPTKPISSQFFEGGTCALRQVLLTPAGSRKVKLILHRKKSCVILSKLHEDAENSRQFQIEQLNQLYREGNPSSGATFGSSRSLSESKLLIPSNELFLRLASSIVPLESKCFCRYGGEVFFGGCLLKLAPFNPYLSNTFPHYLSLVRFEFQPTLLAAPACKAGGNTVVEIGKRSQRMACQDFTCFRKILYAIRVVFGKSPRPSLSGGNITETVPVSFGQASSSLCCNGLLLHAYKVTDSRGRTSLELRCSTWAKKSAQPCSMIGLTV
jgi:hypothetical protein